ncbi:OmpL47-type beta-barrel domain-containing protein [Cohnella sp. GCM10027633]|uniref:InlB B-repeat-containing protein n=1 Tax=unclassified Cohnella TaxID=2636738 RepID=UPI0036269C24
MKGLSAWLKSLLAIVTVVGSIVVAPPNRAEAASTKLALNTGMVTNESGLGEAWRLVDEQSLAGDPRGGTGGATTSNWQPGWNNALLPAYAYIDLGSNYNVTDIYLRDGPGNANVTFSYGSPGSWTSLFTDPLTGYLTWNAHPVSVTTRYIRVGMTTTSTNFSEIVIYGELSGSDTTAPAAISNLAAPTSGTANVNLTWTAPGDDNATGTAASYDIRYSTSTITAGNWASATQATGEPTPAVAGTSQSFDVTGLTADTAYYFAIRASDEASNVGALSNVVSRATADVSVGEQDWITIGDKHVIGVERSWLGEKGDNTNPGNPYLLFRGYETYKDFTTFDQISAASPSGYWPILSQADRLIPNGNTDKVWRSGAGSAWNLNRVLEIDLKQRHELEEFWFFDGGAYRPSAYWNFTDPSNPVPDVPGDPLGVGSKWEVIGGSINVYGYLEEESRYELLFSYDMNNDDSWVQVDLSDLSAFANHTNLTYEQIKRVSKIKIEKVSEDKYHWWEGADVYRNFDTDVNLSSFVMVGKPITRSHVAAVQRSWLGNDGKSEVDGSPYLLFDGYDSYKNFTTFEEISAAAPNGYWPILGNEVKALPTNDSVWRTGEGGSNALEIALNQKHTLQELWLFDGAAYGATSNAIPGQTSQWQVAGGSVKVSAYVDDQYVELFTRAMNNDDSWVRMDLASPASFGAVYDYDDIKNATKLKIEKLSGGTYKYKNFADDIITVDRDVNLSELVIVGLPLEPLVADSAKRDIVPIDWNKEPQTVPDFDIDFGTSVGTNSFFNDPNLNEFVVPISGTTREYHTWAWTEYMVGNDLGYGDNDPRMIEDPEKPLVAFVNTWGAFDAFYRNMKAAGAIVYLCMQNLHVGDANRTDPAFMIPNFQGDGDRQNPNSYLAHAMSFWQHVARYGSAKSIAEGGTIDPDLVHVAPGTSKEIGLNLIEYYENGNELNLKGVNGYEFAAMTSADYDGHMNSMKAWIHDTDIPVNSRSGNYIYTEEATGKPYSGVGIKNADPNAKLSIAGVGGLDLKFMEEMTEWFLTYRTEDDYLAFNYVLVGGSYYRTHDTGRTHPYTRAQALLGEENPAAQENFLYRFEQFPVDVLNVHHYTPDSKDVANGRPIGGVAPEEDQWTHQTWNQDVPLEYGMKWVMNLRSLYYPNAEVWLSELGWDTAQGTATSAKANQTYYPGVNAQLELDPAHYASLPGSNNPATLQNVAGGFEMQGRWMVREFLLLASWGVDRAQQFMLRGSGTGTTGKFNTSGYLDTQEVLGEGTTAKKPAWYYVAAMRNWLGDMQFEQEVETPTYTKKVEPWDSAGNAFSNNNTTPANALNVLRFGHDDENEGKDEEEQDHSKGFALWLGTSKGDIAGNYVDYELDLSNIDLADVEDIKLVELEHKNATGVTTSILSQLANGKVTVRVTEKPVFVIVAGEAPVPTAHNVTIGLAAHGSVTTNKAQAIEGEMVTLTVAPNPEYRLQLGSLKVNGSAAGLTSLGNNQYAFAMPDENVTVTVTFVALDADNDYAVLYEENFNASVSVGGGAWAGDSAAIVNRPDGDAGDKAVQITQVAGNNLYQLPGISFESGVDYTFEYDFRGDSGIDGTSFFFNDSQRLFDGDAPVDGLMNVRSASTWSAKTYAKDQWHHFKLQFRHDGVKWSFTLYIDNVLMANGPVATATATGSQTVKLKNGYLSDVGGKAYYDNFLLYQGQQEVVKTPHSITVPGAMTGGSVTANKTTATEGETFTLTIAPQDGYALSWLKINGINQSVAGGSHIVLMPDEAVVVTAAFEERDVPYVVLYEENYDSRNAPSELSGWAGTGSAIVAAPGGGSGKALEITQTSGNSLYQFPLINFESGIDYTLEYDYMGKGTSTGNALFLGWSERFYDSDGGSDPSKLHLRMWQSWIAKSYAKDAWHHFKAEFKHNGAKWTVRLFLNGVLVDENSVNGAVSLNQQLMLKVGGTGGINYFDNVVLYQGENSGVEYAVTLPGGVTGGSITADKVTAAEGDTVTLTVVRESGYRLKSIAATLDGYGTEVALTPAGSNKFAFLMPARAITVTAAFDDDYAVLLEENFDSRSVPGEVIGWAGTGSAIVAAPGGVGGKALEITQTDNNSMYQFPSITLEPNVNYTLEYDFRGSGTATGNALYLGWSSRFYDSDGPAQGNELNLRPWNTWSNKYYSKDAWHHFKVTFTHDGTQWNFTLYLDNVAVAAGPSGANVTGSVQLMLKLGATAAGGKGTFDNIVLYKDVIDEPAPDQVPPNTSAVTTGDLQAGVYRSAVQIAFVSSDDDSGVAATYYQIDDGEPVIGTQTTIATEGEHTVRYWSIDQEGNEESLKSLSFTIDLTPPTDHATAAPGVPVLSNDNGYDTGLRDGSYTVKMNVWWGNNGTKVKLYENGTLIRTVNLSDRSPTAQSADFVITARNNGTYVYTCELSNAYGSTSCAPMTVTVTDASPGQAVLSNDNWDQDGNYRVTMNLWWGTNATSYELYENGIRIDSQSLVASTPNAQSASTTITGRAPGTYVYEARLINDAGATATSKMTITVR